MNLATRTFRREDWKITSPFGSRIHPVTKVKSFHSGIDFGTQLQNWNIFALEEGKVVASNQDSTNGNYIWVEYPRIDLKVFYCHLEARSVVKGQSVDENTILGQVGSSGRSTAIHLHMGVKHISDDKYFDYEDYEHQEETSSKLKVIDISTWQKNVDYVKVKNDGVQEVILRVGYTGSENKSMNIDALFETHYKGFKEVGMPISVYWFSRATTTIEAVKEATATLEYIKGKDIKEVFWDTEDTIYQNKITKERLTEVALVYLNQITRNGYKCGVYASKSWLELRLDMSKLENFIVWVAQYNEVCTYKGKYDIWQFTSKGKIDGIHGDVDVNWYYLNKPNGIWDAEFTKTLQKHYKTTVDGIISRQIKQKANENIHKITWGLGGSQLVKAMQKDLGIKQDGYLGKGTISALQKRMGTSVTGYITKDDETVRRMKQLYGE